MSSNSKNSKVRLSLWSRIAPRHGNLGYWQTLVLVVAFVLWHVFTSPTLLPPIYFDDNNKAAFFFGEPLKVMSRLWDWFYGGEIYAHLWITLVETMLAFFIGTVAGVLVGLWLALSPMASAIFDPYIKAMNAMPRVILAPIFFVWFGLGISSKVALGVTLVFFIVFFNVYQGVKEVSPVVLANARMLGASQRQLLRQQFIELHALPGRMRARLQCFVFAGLGMMQRLDRSGERGQLERCEDLLGQHLVQRFLGQGAPDKLAKRRLAEARRGGIHRREGIGQRLGRAQHAKTRMNHLAAEEAALHFAEGAHRRPLGHRGGLAGIEIEEAQVEAARIVGETRHQLAPRTIHDLGLHHLPLHLHRAALQGCPDGGEAGFILVAQRQVQHQIEVALYAQLGQP